TAALEALMPMERFLFRTGDPNARAAALDRIRFIHDGDGFLAIFLGGSEFIEGRLEYDYPLYMPFVGRMFSAFGDSDRDNNPNTGQFNRNVNNWAYDNQTDFARYPTLTIRSNNDAANAFNAGADVPRPHRMTIQRRWQY